MRVTILSMYMENLSDVCQAARPMPINGMFHFTYTCIWHFIIIFKLGPLNSPSLHISDNLNTNRLIVSYWWYINVYFLAKEMVYFFLKVEPKMIICTYGKIQVCWLLFWLVHFLRLIEELQTHFLIFLTWLVSYSVLKCVCGFQPYTFTIYIILV